MERTKILINMIKELIDIRHNFVLIFHKIDNRVSVDKLGLTMKNRSSDNTSNIDSLPERNPETTEKGDRR